MSVSVDFFSTGFGQRRGIMRSNSYYMLISSLPALPPRFDVDRLPITLERLQALVDSAATTPPRRVPTRPSKAAHRRRVEGKVRRGKLKAARRGVVE